MPVRQKTWNFAVLAVLVSFGAGSPVISQDQVISAGHLSFTSQIRPILSNHCWSCHGPDEAARQGGLRLDLADAAVVPAESGKQAIVPGKASQSELLMRITSDDPDVVMPPPATGKPLSVEQKQLLKQWIEEGAEYSQHWAFAPPSEPPVPAVQDSQWPKNPIDHFVLQRLEQVSRPPSEESSPLTWLRRMTLDLTGLPPSVDEQLRFEESLQKEPRESVYTSTVDRLMNSPAYAERMAMHWLDGARYADTNGYNNDETRTMWPWRDWVIRAFASNMPYDRFITEQLAGDLIPNATLDQKVASGFNRNHVLTTEGGIIEEEYHVEYVADRVHTTATVFLALSMQCARCHDHKYDPITQKQYYQFAAFFNNVPDKIVPYSKGRMAEPLLKVPSPAQQEELTSIDAQTARIATELAAREKNIDSVIEQWETGLTPEKIAAFGPPGLSAHFTLDESEGAAAGNSVNAEHSGIVHGTAQRRAGKIANALAFDGGTWVSSPNAGDFDSDDRFTISAWIFPESDGPATVLSRMDDDNAFRGYDLIVENGKLASHMVHSWPDNGFKVVTKNPLKQKEWQHVAMTWDGSRQAAGLTIYVNGNPEAVIVTTDHRLEGSLKTDKPFHIGRRHASAPFKGMIDDVQIYSSALSADDVRQLASGQSLAGLRELLAVPAASRSDEQKALLRQFWLTNLDDVTRQLKSEQQTLAERRTKIESEIPVTMIMAEPAEARPIFVLKRGQYDQHGEQVGPAYPHIFDNTFKADTAGNSAETDVKPNESALNRLDLAKWLTDPQHPLTARVAVNRWWEMLFGTGIVETSEDFGMQGANPSHPELLDWLASQLIRSGWDQRSILRSMVLSATYRQSAAVTPEMLQFDPRNRLLARGSRFRLSAETVRDNALFVSGLLKQHVGGPSVKPYQPEGLWEDVSVERRDKYVPDFGDGLYRRSMYTFWKRTCPPPGMATFDAPDRETCVIRRSRTNTPLQALLLLNDPTYVEASRKLAECVILKANDDNGRIAEAWRIVLARTPEPVEQQSILKVLNSARALFAANEKEAQELLAVGYSKSDPGISPSELAAWTTVMSMLLNTDEAISRP